MQKAYRSFKGGSVNDWTIFIEKWFSDSQIPFADYEFDIMKQELLSYLGLYMVG